MQQKNKLTVDSIDFNAALKRIWKIAGKTTLKIVDNELAEILGLSPQNFGQKKSRKTLMPNIVLWAINEGINVQLIFTGETETGSEYRETSNGHGSNMVKEGEIISGLPPDEEELIRLYRQADEDRRRHLLDCARIVVDATTSRAESQGNGGRGCDSIKKKSASK